MTTTSHVSESYVLRQRVNALRTLVAESKKQGRDFDKDFDYGARSNQRLTFLRRVSKSSRAACSVEYVRALGRYAKRIVELASDYGRFGYRRMTALLHCEGWLVNHNGSNGYVESFNGKLREEPLAREQFDTLLEAKVLSERRRRTYNAYRPHSSLGYRPPAPEAIEPASIASATLQQSKQASVDKPNSNLGTGSIHGVRPVIHLVSG